MPDKNEIERRKQIARDLRLKARQEFENNLPTSRENFKALFNYLDEQLTENNCDHSLKISIKFLQSLNLDNVEVIVEWLKENGGYCDCEALANVEEKFDDHAIL
jgi:hypothetical protein